MNQFTKTASAMFLTAALWSGISCSNALIAYAAEGGTEQNVGQNNNSSISSVINVISDDVYDDYLEETGVASASEVKAQSAVNLAITKQPANYTGAAGSQATFSVTAVGTGLSYQWQLSDDGKTWRNSSVKTATYTATLSTTNHGRSVRCIVTDASGKSVTSNAATMTIKGASTTLAITKQPANYTGAAGSKATFTVTASGTGLSYQWQLSDDGKTWRNSSTKTATYTATLSTTNHGRSVRCIVTDASGKSVTSNAATMTIKGLSTALAITKQPTNYTGAAGSQASFSVTANGVGLSYQWQLSDDGKTWRNSSTKTATYTATLSTTNHGRSVRCIVTDASGKSVTSNAATMTIKGLSTALAITKQPTNYTGAAGSQASFSVTANGVGLSYQWQLSDDGKTWRNSSTKTATYAATLSTTNHGRSVRCIVTDASGKSVTSNAATMTIKGLSTALSITKQPTNYTGAAGSKATFSVTANGVGLSYQWQLSDDGKTWRNSSTKTATYTATLSTTNHGRSVRCIVTDASGKSVTSNAATMTIKGLSTALAITKQPTNYTGAAGSQATFSVTANGVGLSYQWQLSDDGKTWRNSSTKTATYAATLSTTNHGRSVRCIVTDASGKSVTSNAATMTIKGLSTALAITKQPTNYTGAVGSQATFTVTAGGVGLSYQWQLSDDGKTWRNSSTKTATYTATLSATNHGRSVRCIVTDASGKSVTSNAATMKIAGYASITKQPTNYTGRVGDKVTFTVGAEGTGLSYQWQTGGDGTNWTNTTVKTATYTTTLSAANNGQRFRCVVTDSTGRSLTSNAVSMRVLGLVTITEQPSDYTGKAGDQMTFTVKAAGYGLSYQWQTSKDNGANWSNSTTSTTYSATLNTTNSNSLVRCVVTDADGYKATSNTVKMSIKAPITINEQPAGYVGLNGEQVEFRVLAEGDNVLSYVWQLSDDNGKTWRGSSVTTYNYMVTISDKTNGRSFRCVIKDNAGHQLISNAAKLTMVTSVTPGFITRNGVTKYRYADGSYANGLVEIGGKYYYFTSNILRTGNRQINGKQYYFDEHTGEMYTGWYNNLSDGKTYYLRGIDGAAMGFTKIDGEYYYFNEYGVAKTGLMKLNGAYYYFDEYSYAAKRNAFVTTDYGDTYYFGSDGKSVTGWQTIDGKKYYFLENYTISRGLTNIGGKRYYFDFDTGESLVKDSLVWIGMNQLMYLKADGGFYTGYTVVNGVPYYFSDSGVAVSGLKEITVNGVKSKYCFAKNTFEAQKGFVEYNDKTYYFDSNYRMVTGLNTINKELYYFDNTGVMNTGRVIMSDSTVYCFDETTGKAITGWYTYVNGSKYYFDKTTHKALKGWQTISELGAKYCFETNGYLKTGLIRDDSNKLYLFDADGTPVTGWYSDGADTYYFSKTDKTALAGLNTIDGELYYFSKSYKLQIGYTHLDSNYYFFDPRTGKALKGFIKTITSGGTAVYYGDPKTGVLVTGVTKINGDTYCFNSAGVMRVGTYYGSDKTYQLDPVTGKEITSVKAGTTVSSWVTSNGKKSYVDGSGNKVTGIAAIGGKLYCFDAGGNMTTGFQTIDGVTYYFNSQGVMLTGLQTISGKTYYFNADDGSMKIGFAKISGKLYCFNQNGVLQKNGFFKFDGKSYCANPDGEIITGLVTIGGKQYYFLSNGEQKFGRVYIDSKLYYFDQTTGERKLGFVEYGGKRFYYDNSDKGFLQGKQVIDGKTYLFLNGDGSVYKGYCMYENKNFYMDATTGESLSGIYAKPNGAVYYFLGNGNFGYGLQTINGKKYYFYPATGEKVNGLHSIGSKLYYFDEKNGMLTNQTVTVEGVQFKLASDGSATVLGDSNEAKLLRAGMEYLGQPYKAEVQDSVDILSCSGFVRQMYSAINIDLAGSSYRQFFNLSRDHEVVDSINYASPGDLVFYISLDCGHGDQCGFLGEIHHVAMYVGDGKIIEANKNESYSELNCIILQNYGDSTSYFPYKIVKVLD